MAKQSTLTNGDWVYLKSDPNNRIKIKSIDEDGFISPRVKILGVFHHIHISEVEKITDEIEIAHLDNLRPFLTSP